MRNILYSLRTQAMVFKCLVIGARTVSLTVLIVPMSKRPRYDYIHDAMCINSEQASKKRGPPKG